jgi:hypothetical protein
VRTRRISGSKKSGTCPKLIERTLHAASTLIEYVCVNHRRAHISVSKQLLDRADIVARLEQVRRERVAK